MWNIVTTFIAAALVIYISYYCSKRIGQRMNRSSSSTYMRLVDQILVGQDRYIAIVQAGEKYLLLGITAGQINLLTEVEEGELSELSQDETDTGTPKPDFRALLEKFSNRDKKGR